MIITIICSFSSNINDIHAVLEITVLDEDKNKVYEFLGKIAIPLINVYLYFTFLSISFIYF